MSVREMRMNVMKRPSVKTLLGAITAHVMLATLEMDLTAPILMNVMRCYMTATYLPSA
jgi:hypothetical protein